MPPKASRSHFAATPFDMCQYIQLLPHKRMYEIISGSTCRTHLYIDFEAQLDTLVTPPTDTITCCAMLVQRLVEFFAARDMAVDIEKVCVLIGDRVTKNSAHIILPLHGLVFAEPPVVRKVVSHFLAWLLQRHPHDYAMIRKSGDSDATFVDLAPYSRAQNFRMVYSHKIQDPEQTPLLPIQIDVNGVLGTDWSTLDFENVVLQSLAGVTLHDAARLEVLFDWDGPVTPGKSPYKTLHFLACKYIVP